MKRSPLPVCLALLMVAGAAAQDDAWLARQVAAGGVVRLEARSYVLKRPLNLRDQKWVTIEGAGPKSLIVGAFDDPAGAAWPIVDMTGALSCTLRGVQVRNAGEVVPACGILLARSSPRSSPTHVFDQVHVTGRYRIANVVNVGSEVNTWTHPQLINGQPGGHNYVTGAWWPETWRARVVSPYGELWAGREWGGSDYAADGVHTFVGGTFGVYGYSGQECNLWLLPGARSVTLTGTHFSNRVGGDKSRRAQRGSGGLAGIRIGVPGGRDPNPVDLTLSGCYLETDGARNTLLVHQDARVSASGGSWLALEDCVRQAGRGVEIELSALGVRMRGGYAEYERGD